MEKAPEQDFVLSHRWIFTALHVLVKNKARVLLLGGAGVGKTTLVKRFQSPASFEEEEKVKYQTLH